MPAAGCSTWHRASILLAIPVVLASAVLAACGSKTPETIKYPASHAAVMQVSAQGSVPLPPQPSYQPVLHRQPVATGADGALASRVESALAVEPDLDKLGIDVTAVEGTVYLRGHARTRDIRRRATQVASSVHGVKRVQNELFVSAGSQGAESSVPR